jgi:hypothetical protein
MKLQAFIQENNLFPNPIEQNASINGCLFETFGKQLEFVKNIFKASPDNVYTVCEKNGNVFVQSGYHWVNRIGYFITKI